MSAPRPVIVSRVIETFFLDCCVGAHFFVSFGRLSHLVGQSSKLFNKTTLLGNFREVASAITKNIADNCYRHDLKQGALHPFLSCKCACGTNPSLSLVSAWTCV